MESQIFNIVLLLALGALLIVLIWLSINTALVKRRVTELPDLLQTDLQNTQQSQHRAMLTDLADSLAKQGERISTGQIDAAQRLSAVVSGELEKTRVSLQTLQVEQSQNLNANREALIHQLSQLTLDLAKRQETLKMEMLGGTLEKLAEQSRAQQETLQNIMRTVTAQVTNTIESLTKTNDARLNEISGKVNERLDEGFKKTNETFVNVIARLATIDEAQKKIDGLTTNVVSLQQLLGDKRSRGAFGEIQLETIIKNVLPTNAYEFQYTFSNRARADCVLKLPEPTGLIAVDSKFPLENYERMLAEGADRATPAAFKADVRKHIDDISSKYIIHGETGDGAVMFLPAEAVFAEIHAHHRDLVEYAARKRVWIVSPTTMMAVLNTALAVLKDVETRKQVHVIKDALGKLGGDFGRFQARMDDLAKHIGQVSKDVELVHTSSKKITEQFYKIEKVEIEPALSPPVAAGSVEAKPVLTVVKPANDI
jgi:DNA recombination protein RmuC